MKINDIILSLKENNLDYKIYNNINLDSDIENITTDSRKKLENALFLPLKGENFNGHDFILPSIENGSKYIVFDERLIEQISEIINKNKDILFISVGISKFKLDEIFYDDIILFCYGIFAKFYREKYLNNLKIIAITGSVGKTTIKNFLGHIICNISPHTYISFANFNNLIGVPYNIFQIKKYHKIAILELGMNKLGEISFLSKISSPDIAVILNISPIHIGNFFLESEKSNNIENDFITALNRIKLAKLEILDGLKKNGIFFYNSSINLEKNKLKNIDYVSYSINNDNIISDIKCNIKNNSLNIKAKSYEYNIDLPLYFSLNLIKNITASFSVIISSRLFSSEQIASSFKFIENFDINQNLNGRGSVIKKDNFIFIDESYNGGFDSVIESIDRIAKINESIMSFGRKILILGQMNENGIFSKFMQLKVEEKILENIDLIDYIILIGNSDILTTYQNLIKNYKNIKYFENVDEFLLIKNSFLKEKDLILIKGANSLKLNKII